MNWFVNEVAVNPTSRTLADSREPRVWRRRRAVEPGREGGRSGWAYPTAAKLADADRGPRPSRVWVAGELSVYSAVDRTGRAGLVGVAHAVPARCLERARTAGCSFQRDRGNRARWRSAAQEHIRWECNPSNQPTLLEVVHLTDMPPAGRTCLAGLGGIRRRLRGAVDALLDCDAGRGDRTPGRRQRVVVYPDGAR